MNLASTVSPVPPQRAAARPMPRWFTAASVLGLAWNAFGVAQFLDYVRATADSLQAMGLTAAQAQLYAAPPAWMIAAFALGVFGGLAGSGLLLARRRLAVPVLLASLVGYLVLYVGDLTQGVFAALGGKQVAILTTVVAIAAALLVLARRFEHRGLR